MGTTRGAAAFRSLCVILCATALVPGDTLAYMPQQQTASGTPTSQAQSVKIPPDQLDSLVAPIALYPDPLLAQVLAASTYPLEIIQLQQWLTQHKDLRDKGLADAVAKEGWDASIQDMAALPDVVNRLVVPKLHFKSRASAVSPPGQVPKILPAHLASLDASWLE